MSPFQMNVTGKLWAMSRGKFRTMRAECRKESLDQFKTPDSNRPSTHQPQKHFRMMALMLRGLPIV